jgi:Glycosyltransferase sugar-binding region containing DXD motif
MTMVASPGRSSNQTGSTASAVVSSSNGTSKNHHHPPPPKLQPQQQHPNILFIAMGFLLVANVCCFMLFAVLLDPEPETHPLVARRGPGPPTISGGGSNTTSKSASLDVTTAPADRVVPAQNDPPVTTYLRRAGVEEETSSNSGTSVVGQASAQNNSSSSRTAANSNRSVIPRVLIFTHSLDLLHEDLNFIQDDAHYEELVTLQANVQSIIDLHEQEEQQDGSTTVVRFLTNEQCIESIRTTTAVNSTLADELVGYFEREATGMYKADLCRGIALYETGGLYFDVDLGVRMNIFHVLHAPTEFATIRVHPQSLHPGNFFQAFIASIPQHAVLQRYIELFVEYYRGHLTAELQRRPVGVVLLRMAFDQVEEQQRRDLSLTNTNTNTTNATMATTTHLNQTSEIWQEFHYNYDYQHTLLAHVPPPDWGTRRACKFIVLSAPQLPLTVPFYSRIAGSRMCPKNKETTTTSTDGQPEKPNGIAQTHK